MGASVLLMAAGRFAVGAALFVAALMKLSDLDRFSETLRTFPVTRRFVHSTPTARVAAIALVIAEGSSGAAFAFGYRIALSGGVVLGLLIAFSFAIATALRSGEAVSCRCFGEASDRPVGPRSVGRNLALLVLAALGMYSRSVSIDGVIAGELSMGDIAALAFVAIQILLGVGLLRAFTRLGRVRGYLSRSRQRQLLLTSDEVWVGARETTWRGKRQ